MSEQVNKVKPELLALILTKSFWRKNKNKVLKSMFDKPLDKVFESIEAFHTMYDEDLNKDKLWEIVRVDHPTLTFPQKTEIMNVLNSMEDRSHWTEEFGQKILDAVWAEQVFSDIARIGIEGAQGKVKDLEQLKDIIDKHGSSFIPKDSFVECDAGIEELMEQESHTTKWKFQLPTLQEKIGSLSPGHFLQIMARPDCFAKGTMVLMYDGTTKPVEEIKVGDKLMGPDSSPRNVLRLTSGKSQMYKVSYPWGEGYTVNENHELALSRSKVETRHKYGDVVLVKVTDYLKWPQGRKDRYKGFKVGVEYKHKIQKLNSTEGYQKKPTPYMLGLWLGDGSSAKPEITNTDKQLIDYINKYAKTNGYSVHKRFISYYLSGGFVGELREVGVFNNKHIPHSYMSGSRAERLQLLAGLIDSDGYFGGHAYEISAKSAALADQIVTLARSLGMHSTVTRKHKRCQTGKGGYYSRVYISGPGLGDIPCLVTRKKYKTKVGPKRNQVQHKIRVRRAGIGKYYGFTVDGDNLFLLADFTVVKNCGKTAWIVNSVAAPGGWADQGAKIDWYVNEEPVKRTRWRCISAYTGMTKDQLIDNKHAAGQIWDKIKQNVRTFDIPFGTPVERIAARTRERKPDIVIVDQIDKLGVKPMAGEFAGETDRIRLLYIKFREIAKHFSHQCLVVGVCQASADAEGHTIVTYDMAENSKTGKAAECDVFLGIGRRALKEGMIEEDYTRWITISKNKLDTGWKGVLTCKLQPTISRFEV